MNPSPKFYYAYIASSLWKTKAQAAYRRAGYRCQVCNSGVELHAHHRTYERLGRERAMDITVLCAGCHALFSNKIGKVNQDTDLEMVSHLLNLNVDFMTAP